MHYLYWILALPTGLLASLVILLTLSGRALSSSTPSWLALGTAAIVLAMLWWSYQLIFEKNHPFLALLTIVGSWVIFVVILAGYGLMTTKNWQ